MEGAVSETMQTGGSGVKAEPGKMHASKSEVQADMRSTCRARACKQEGRKREREGKRRKEDKRRLSALGSQDALVKARQVGPGIDASAILFKHQREA